MLRFYFIIIINLFRTPYLIPRLIYMSHHLEKYTLEKRYAVVRRIIRIIKRSGNIWTKGYGKENLPQEGGYVMFANHQGRYDSIGIIHTHAKPCSVVIDEQRSRALLLNQVTELLEGKRMKRDDIRQSMKIIKEVAEEAAQGKRFLIYPEGGYERNRNQVQAFKPGCFKSAMLAKVPIVPVALVDSYKVFDGKPFGMVRTRVYYLEPISYEEYKDKRTVEVAEIVRQRIINKIDEVLAERKQHFWQKIFFYR